MSIQKSGKGRSVVVTGAATGLGFATAKMLKEQGWRVYGTYLEFQSSDELKNAGIIPVLCDISDYKQADAAAKFVAENLKGKGLSALINVAGVAGVAAGLIEGVQPERVKLLFDTNITGTLNMCRSFLPLLRKFGPARIVNVSSSALRVPAVFTSIYSISKYAIEGITNSLRFELMPFGIQCTSIEPGGMKTPMSANSQEATKKNWDMMGQEIHDIYYPKVGKSLEFIDKMIKTSSEPEAVAKKIIHALNVNKMKKRYLAGATVEWMGPAERILGENAFERLMAKMQKLI